MDSSDDYSDDDFKQTYSTTIQDKISKTLNKNKHLLQASRHRIIPNTNIYLNSVNIFVGRQGSGKSVQCIKEIIKISENHPETHLLIYLNKTGEETDYSAFEPLKKLIKIPILYVSHENATQALEMLNKYKKIYNDIKINHLDNELPKNLRRELCNKLYINDLSRPYLHTLIMFEDTVDSPVLKNKMVLEMFTKCRHYNVSCFLLVQFWKGLSPTIKENVSTIFYFGGSTPRQFYHMMSQAAVNVEDNHELFQHYRQLSQQDKMIIDNYTHNVHFEGKED